MGLRRLLALLFSALISLVGCQAQIRGCNESALNTESSLRRSIELALGGASSGGANETVASIAPSTITIHRQHTVCLAAAEVRDEYRFASVVVSFTCEGDLPEGSQLGTYCSANYTSQFDLECEPSTLEWVPSNVTGTTNFYETAHATFNTTLDRFCSFCLDPASLQPAGLVDTVTHCYGESLSSRDILLQPYADV